MCPLRGQSLESRLAAQRSVRQALELNQGTAVTSTLCPSCGLINPRASGHCDCGWDFARKQMGKGFPVVGERPAVGSSAILIGSAVLGLAGPAIPLSHLPVGFVMGSLLFGGVGHGGFWYWFLGPGGWPLWVAWAGYSAVAYLGIKAITRLRGRRHS